MRRPAGEELGCRDGRAGLIPDGRISDIPTRIERMGSVVHCHEYHNDAAHGIDGRQSPYTVSCWG